MSWTSWTRGFASSVVSLASMGHRSQTEELRTTWASVRRFFRAVDNLDDAAIAKQLGDVKSKFDRIASLLRDERGTHGSALRAEVFELDAESESGYFEHACTFSKTSPLPGLRAVTLEFLVDAIVAAVDGTQAVPLLAFHSGL